MKDKIQELRKRMPIPMSEAILLLKEKNGDIEQCLTFFKTKSIKHICELTGCDKETAEQHYETENFDFNRTVSTIREAIYDQNYKTIEGLTKENIRMVIQWLAFIQEKDFATALDYKEFDTITHTFSLIPFLKNIEPVFRKAKAAKDTIFEGYTHELSIDEFVRRHKRLDDDLAFQEANQIINLRMTVIKEELLRHYRNL